ncbi:TonB-dependent receptor [Steroidobacter agaridevorans]|uniref:TonB-dependent receptor n=1 Tax=Steroidobacter agaridevorans TaxID=2695856 RepID=UPI00132640A5|nr:TonB-dependent receptor [Steroidobacter agaridevorans]GFE89997.1 TonB-dependent receptor [Steroidobacter agaridevorans]
MRRSSIAAGLGLALAPALLQAGGIPTTTGWLEEVVVTGKLDRLEGDPISATVGVVTSEQLDLRPVLRVGELLEVVPGLIVTQHSGGGKANQYFLRGFNLDHGTDLATSVDGVPVNMPSHGHGQGYTDINFVIPELVNSIDYRKGTYYADTGNFSAAGAINMRYRNSVDTPIAQLDAGEDGYRRALLALSPRIGNGTLLFGVEHSQTDGPWLLDENFRKTNALLRYSRETDVDCLAITSQVYEGEWRSTDQIPLRLVRDGALDRFGFIDPTDGGESHRYSLGADWISRRGSGELQARGYAIDYRLDLFSNFTYALDPIDGDQFEQLDDRRIFGGAVEWRRPLRLGKLASELEIGVEFRRDDIDIVGLYRTVARERIGTGREDAVVQTSYSAYSSLTTTWTEQVRTSAGIRADYFDFDVGSNRPENSGTASDSIASPKFSLILGPWKETELFVNVGKGFHSNDARGTTLRVDPTDGVTPADRVDPLVGALGADVGVRTAILPKMQLSVSLWTLELDSELLFVGDAGVTEPSRESKRRGVEVGAIWNPLSWLIVDADLAWSRASVDDPVGSRIPGAVENVASIGVAIDHPSGWFGGARFRHFGKAPLIEDGSVESEPTTLVNLEAGYRITDTLSVSAAVFNIFDSDDNDITYFYESQLPGEAAPVEDIHFHPVEPRTVRFTVTGTF